MIDDIADEVSGAVERIDGPPQPGGLLGACCSVLLARDHVVRPLTADGGAHGFLCGHIEGGYPVTGFALVGHRPRVQSAVAALAEDTGTGGRGGLGHCE